MNYLKSWIKKTNNKTAPVSLYHLKDNVTVKNDGYKNSQSSSVRFISNWVKIDEKPNATQI